MSKSGWIATPESIEYEFYETEINHARKMVNLLSDTFSPRRVLDPGAGTGVYGAVVRERYVDAEIIGIELRSTAYRKRGNYWQLANRQAHTRHFYGYDWWIHGADFTTMGEQPMIAEDGEDIRFDLVIGNPPFSLMTDFIRTAWKLTKPGGRIFFLARIGYLASVQRYQMFKKDYKPKTVYVLSDRPSFSGDGKTDSYDYVAIKWLKGYMGETKLEWVLSRPKNILTYDNHQMSLWDFRESF